MHCQSAVSNWQSAIHGLRFVLLEEQRGVGAAEPERVRQRVPDRDRTALVWNVIEVALLVGDLEVDRGRSDLMVHGEGRDTCFESAGAAEQVAGHRLGGRHSYLVGVVAECALDGQRL